MFTAFFIFSISSRMVPSRVRISVSFPNTRFKKQFGGDQCLFKHEFLVLLQSQCAQFRNVIVQFLGRPIFPFSASF